MSGAREHQRTQGRLVQADAAVSTVGAVVSHAASVMTNDNAASLPKRLSIMRHSLSFPVVVSIHCPPTRAPRVGHFIWIA